MRPVGLSVCHPYKTDLIKKIKIFQIPDLTFIIEDVDGLLSNNTVESIRRGKSAFENIRKELNSTIATNIPTVTDALNEAGELKFGLIVK